MVFAESKAALTALAELAPRLNKATDSLMQEIHAIEETLEKLKIGLPWEMKARPIHAHEEERENDNGELVTYRYISFLAYERLTTGWGLTVRDYRGLVNQRGDSVDRMLILTTPLLNSAREIRIEAARLIPAFLNELVEATTQSLESLHALAAVTNTSAPEKSRWKTPTDALVAWGPSRK